METDRLIEVFELLKKTLINGETYNQSGICGEINELYVKNLITPNEKEFIRMYLFNNKPRLHNIYSEFRDNKYWIDDSFWWRRMCFNYPTKQIRIDYLTKLIANIK